MSDKTTYCACGDSLDTTEARACGACVDCAQRQLAEAKPYMDALHNAHNGYLNDEYPTPASPAIAIDQLIDEANEIGRAEGQLEAKAQLATANAVIEAQSDVLGWYMEECAEGDAEPPAELQELFEALDAAEAARKSQP